MNTVIIQPYFGIFPIWMDLFLFSCSKNKQVDFVFFTDCIPSLTHLNYSNITFHKTSFDDYCMLVSERLGIDFKPEKTYKLCDLKPFLGVIHQDIIDSYDCWGYCDIDLVLGDLTTLLNKMSTYDLISTHADRLSGHFTLMKTKSKFTRACFKIRNWKKKLMMQKHKCLDETDLTKVVARFMFYKDAVYRRFIRNHSSIIDTLYSKVANFILSIVRDNKVNFEELHTTPIPDYTSKYVYDTKTGKVFDVINKRELPYLHFLFFKKTQYSDNTDYWTNDSYHFQQGESFLDCKGVEFTKTGVLSIV